VAAIAIRRPSEVSTHERIQSTRLAGGPAALIRGIEATRQ